ARYIRGESQTHNVADIAAIVIDERNGVPVTIADVAKVHPAPMIRAGLVTRDGQGEIVTGLVMMLIGENSRRVVGRVKQEIGRLQASLPPGVTTSLMSLGAIDFGMLVDSSVIMIENCVRRLAHERGTRPRLDIIRDAAIEVRKPTMFGELIIAIVYLPILALQGTEGKLFRPM